MHAVLGVLGLQSINDAPYKDLFPNKFQCPSRKTKDYDSAFYKVSEKRVATAGSKSQAKRMALIRIYPQLGWAPASTLAGTHMPLSPPTHKEGCLHLKKQVWLLGLMQNPGLATGNGVVPSHCASAGHPLQVVSITHWCTNLTRSPPLLKSWRIFGISPCPSSGTPARLGPLAHYIRVDRSATRSVQLKCKCRFPSSSCLVYPACSP